MKKLAIFVLIMLLGGIGWYIYRQPYETYQALQISAAENDFARFHRLIDQESVKAHLTTDLTEAIGQVVSPHYSNAFSQLAQNAWPTLLNKIIDPLLTPAGMHQLITQGGISKSLYPGFFSSSVLNQGPTAADLEVGASGSPDGPNQSGSLAEEMEYVSYDTFKVKLQSPRYQRPVILIFHRKNLTSWVLTKMSFGV